jgi:hypothetical protein
MKKGGFVRQYLGTVIFGLLGVAVPVIGAATRWPWPWGIMLGIGVAFVVAAGLSYPVRERPEDPAPQTAFISGDATGSSFGNVYTDADFMVRGDARHAVFWNIIQRPRRRGPE